MLIFIRKSRTHNYWNLQMQWAGGSFNKWYQDAIACQNEALKQWTRFYKENAAFSMVRKLPLSALNTIDYEFVVALQRKKCRGITVRQYGYVKGIYERQFRKW